MKIVQKLVEDMRDEELDRLKAELWILMDDMGVYRTPAFSLNQQLVRVVRSDTYLEVESTYNLLFAPGVLIDPRAVTSRGLVMPSGKPVQTAIGVPLRWDTVTDKEFQKAVIRLLLEEEEGADTSKLN